MGACVMNSLREYEDSILANTDEDLPYLVADCPLCHATGEYLGQLGRWEWYKCRNCGHEFTP